jgi:zinc protease
MRKASILRGPELYIREDHTLPLVQMGFFLPGGRLQETKENAGVTSLMLRLLLGSAEDRETAEVLRQLEIYGAEFSPVVADDYFGVSFTVLSQNIRSGMELLIEMLTSLQFEDEEFERQRELQAIERAEERQVVLPAKDSPAALHLGAYELELREALFQGHPYGRSRFGTKTSLEAMTPDAVRAWHTRAVVNRKPIVVIVGDTKGTELAEYFVRNYSGSRYRDVEIAQTYPDALKEKALIRNQWDLDRSLIIRGYQAPSYQDEDLYTLAVLQSYASGIAGQLQDQLRDRRGLVHNVSLEYLPRWRGGEVRIWATTDPGREEEIEKALDEEVVKIFTAPISYRDYRSAVNTSIAVFWIEQQDRMAQISNQVRNILARRGTAGVEEYAQSSRDVRQEDLPVIAKRILDKEKSVTITVRGKAVP